MKKEHITMILIGIASGVGTLAIGMLADRMMDRRNGRTERTERRSIEAFDGNRRADIPHGGGVVDMERFRFPFDRNKTLAGAGAAVTP